MKVTHLFLADSANAGPGGKINVLGLGIRVFSPGSLPALTRTVLLIGAEATAEELGNQPIKVTLETPRERRLQILDDLIEVSQRDASESALPIEVRAQLEFPFVMESAGRYVIRVQIGRARGSYAVLVRAPGGEDRTVDLQEAGDE